ncbi:PilZ domain-containing protein [Cyanobium sp. Copco_Reservoir_LC18]|uniref:PilZ domain-containing protein n=1 Tax=Cyanobium sp. Copco_Reservoir_LC18 TaxID=1328305 RepID=UPI00135851D9|nr:PilZ domain-containing protein [Cyanobium sp. Copco_Reservoir_LC18]
MSPEDSDVQPQLHDRRSSLRQVLPSGVPASIHLPSGDTGFVMLADISRAGACIVRRGRLEVKPSDRVFLNISDYGLFRNIHLSACVQWVKTWNHRTLLGLAFTEGPLLPGTILDQYLDRALLAPRSLGT